MSEDELGGRRVLVVEDEYFIADDLCKALAEVGAEVLGPFPSVTAAAAFIEQGSPIDTALLDINVQGESVFSVAELLAARDIPFAFATGFDACAIPDRFAGVPHLEKPQKPGNILAALRKIIA